MYRPWGLAVLACLCAALPVAHRSASLPAANPEDGKVVSRKYVNEYFAMAYPLPSGWGEDREGPAPSYTGYYVLSALKSGGGRAGTMLIAAQDQFFAVDLSSRAQEMVERFRRRLAEIDGMMIDHESEEITISRTPFTRLDFNGVGLYRTVLVAERRCHFVSLNLTTADPDERASLTQSLDRLSLGEPADRAEQVPVCVKDYATPEHVISRVEPISGGPKFTSVPVRVIIGADGWVRHIHVIRASADQRANITAALRGWQFRPFFIEGRPVEVETGITFRF
jgi:hypothetical protein